MFTCTNLSIGNLVRVCAIAVIGLSVAGCGGTKLWGKDDPERIQVSSSETLREQAVSVAEPVWNEPVGGHA